VGLLLADLIALLLMPLQAGSPLLKSFQLVRVLHLVPVLLVVNIALAVGWLATPGALTRIGAARRAAVVGLALLGAALVAVQLPPVAKQIGAWLAAGAPLSAMAQSTLAWLLAAIACAAGILGAAAAGAFAMAGRFRGGDGPSRGRMAGAAVVACLVVGLAVDRAAFTRFGLLSGPNMGTWAAWTEPTAAHEYVATQAGGGRVISVLEHPNRGLTARLDGVDGYETVYPKAYHALFGLLIAPQLEASPGLSEYFGTWGNRAYAFTPAISEPIADLLGVRWMLVADAAVDASLTDRAGEQAAVPSWLHEVTKLDGTTVYENPNAFPRAFVVHGIAVDPDVEAATAALAAASPADLRSTVHVVAADADAAGIVLSSTPATAAGPGSPGSPGNAGSPGSPSEAVFTMDTPDRLEIGTSTASEGVLVVADTDARGWVAELDGKPTELFRVDLALRGVKVPAGDHVVTMLYRPIETYAGFAISALTLVAMLAWLVLPAVARRREPQRKATVSEA
jgi:hypothetical protein